MVAMQIDGGLRYDSPREFPPITAQETMAELERLLSDPEFRSTERNKKFLRYAMEQLLQGRGDKVKAYAIAIDVFGRPATFDPGIDPIVRIEATRLRASLTQYYELHAQNGGLRIDLPKGRYVPAVSRLAFAGSRVTGAMPVPDQPGQFRNSGTGSHPSWRTWLRAAASICVAGGLLLNGYFLLPVFGQKKSVFSEKPSVIIDVRSMDGGSDNDAQMMRDALMVALSQFQTLKILVPNRVTPGGTRAASTGDLSQGHYQVVLKYRPGATAQSVWWQIIDLRSGEALISRSKTVLDREAAQTFIVWLANQIAGVEGIINKTEARLDVANPTLGNGCILRAYNTLRSPQSEALQHARACLETTLEQRPNDAEAHAALSMVLLAASPAGTAGDLPRRALDLANRSAGLAPHSASSAVAQMSALYRLGKTEAAILAGRRAISLNPNAGQGLANLGSLLFMTGRWEEGLSLVTKAAQIDARISG
ncbi:MAG: hypothetical protein ACRECY_05510 [Phyllobacterium sp.]